MFKSSLHLLFSHLAPKSRESWNANGNDYRSQITLFHCEIWFIIRRARLDFAASGLPRQKFSQDCSCGFEESWPWTSLVRLPWWRACTSTGLSIGWMLLKRLGQSDVGTVNSDGGRQGWEGLTKWIGNIPARCFWAGFHWMGKGWLHAMLCTCKSDSALLKSYLQ